MSLPPRAVIVHRRTEFDELMARHGTRGQAAFFLESRGRTLDEVQARHDATRAARTAVDAGVPEHWRRGTIERADLSRFAFGPEDVVIVVGPDGLVANVAKYLTGQPVIGVDPEPGRNAGVLVTHAPAAVAALLRDPAALAGHRACTMVQATVDDGLTLRALNELYLGHPSHQSARYRIELPSGRGERHSSSGVLVGTGIGASGWCRSVWRERGGAVPLPEPEDPRLCWFAREAWPSPATGVELTEGALEPDQALTIVAESELVVFGDGLESDALHVSWGQRVTVGRAPATLRLVR
jgi:hypothetical protein